MGNESKAYLLGGGIGSLAAAAFMIRDENIFARKYFHPRSQAHHGREFGWSGEPNRWLFPARGGGC